ncbi:hypothetical protein ACF090_20550 [Streptomyces sp. NPDC014892]
MSDVVGDRARNTGGAVGGDDRHPAHRRERFGRHGDDLRQHLDEQL